jgi:hypothetical protein
MIKLLLHVWSPERGGRTPRGRLARRLAPLSAYADRTDEVQAPYWDRPDPPAISTRSVTTSPRPSLVN